MIMVKKCLKHEKHILDFFYTIAGRNIGADVSAFARLAAGDQIGHPCWSRYSSIRQCKYGKGHSNRLFLRMQRKQKNGEMRRSDEKSTYKA
jgi:hypothetical protein